MRDVMGGFSKAWKLRGSTGKDRDALKTSDWREEVEMPEAALNVMKDERRGHARMESCGGKSDIECVSTQPGRVIGWASDHQFNLKAQTDAHLGSNPRSCAAESNQTSHPPR